MLNGHLVIELFLMTVYVLGWNDLDPSQRSQVQNLFSHTPENDLQLAYDQFIQSLGKSYNTHNLLEQMFNIMFFLTLVSINIHYRLFHFQS